MEVNILLFDDFDTMDAFGPAEVFGSSPQHFHVNYLSVPGNIVNSNAGCESVDRTAGTGRAAGDRCNTRGTGRKTAVISGCRKPASFEENGRTI